MGRKGKEVKDHLGNTYCNTPSMCKAYGVPVGTFVSRRRKGMTIEQSLVKDKYKDHLGNPYHNKKDICDAYGLSTSAFNKRLKAGWSLEDALTLPWSWSKIRACKDHKGNVYSTRKAMCRAYEISVNTLYSRRKKGMTLEQSLTKNNKVKDHLGNIYRSKTAMCKAYGITATCFMLRLEKGWSLKEALTVKSYQKREVL